MSCDVSLPCSKVAVKHKCSCMALRSINLNQHLLMLAAEATESIRDILDVLFSQACLFQGS